MPATPGTGQRHGIETPRPDSIKAAAYADGGVIGSQYAVAPLAQPPLPPPQRYLTIPASRTGDARAILFHGGAFTSLSNEPDNLNGYSLSGMGLAPRLRAALGLSLAAAASVRAVNAVLVLLDDAVVLAASTWEARICTVAGWTSPTFAAWARCISHQGKL